MKTLMADNWEWLQLCLLLPTTQNIKKNKNAQQMQNQTN